MNDALMIITCMVFPFLLAWLIKSVVRLDDEKTASPILPCILMGIDLLILLSALRWYF